MAIEIDIYIFDFPFKQMVMFQLVMLVKMDENCHRNSWFSHEKNGGSFQLVMEQFTRPGRSVRHGDFPRLHDVRCPASVA